MGRWPYARPLCFSEELKEELRKPLGKLYIGDVDSSSSQAVEALRRSRAKPVITIGDVTTSMFMKHGLKPKVAVVDNRFERMSFGERIDFTGYVVNAIHNPAGCIAPEAAEKVFDAVEGSLYVALVVDGEEDLLALPAVLACSEGGAVAYGQPKTGCVVITVDEKTKEKVLDIIRRAEAT